MHVLKRKPSYVIYDFHFENSVNIGSHVIHLGSLVCSCDFYYRIKLLHNFKMPNLVFIVDKLTLYHQRVFHSQAPTISNGQLMHESHKSSKFGYVQYMGDRNRKVAKIIHKPQFHTTVGS